MKFKKEIKTAIIIHLFLLIAFLINLFSGKLLTSYSTIFFLSNVSSVIIGAFVLRRIKSSLIEKILYFVLLICFGVISLAYLIITNVTTQQQTNMDRD